MRGAIFTQRKCADVMLPVLAEETVVFAKFVWPHVSHHGLPAQLYKQLYYFDIGYRRYVVELFHYFSRRGGCIIGVLYCVFVQLASVRLVLDVYQMSKLLSVY